MANSNDGWEDVPESEHGWEDVPENEAPKNESQKDSSKPDLMGAAKKAATDYLTKPQSVSASPFALSPLMELSDRIVQAAYSESKRALLDDPRNPANSIKNQTGKKATKLGESLLVDAAAFTLAGSGVEAASLSKNFLKSKPFASNEEIVKGIMAGSEKLYKKTTELLRPNDIAEYIAEGKTHPAVNEISRIIKKTKSPEEGIKEATTTINKIFGERAKLLGDKNKVVKPSQLDELADFINTKTSEGTATDTQIKAMNEVYAEETRKLSQGKFDLLSAESKKEFYQGMSQRVYSAGGMDELTTGKQQAYTVLAGATKKLIEREIPEVASINSRYEGLVKGRELLAKLQKKILETPSETLNVVADAIHGSNRKNLISTILASGVKKVPGLKDIGTYKSFSGGVEKTRNEVEALRTILQNRIKSAASRGTL
jgi:hypothetical protein